MIEKYKVTGDVFYSISSKKTNNAIFEKATKEIIELLKRYNFDVEETLALLSNIESGIKEVSIYSAYNQELKNLF